MAFYSRKNLLPGKPCAEKSHYSPCPKHVIPKALVFSLGIAGAAFLIMSYLALRICVSRRRRALPPPTYSNREEFADGLRGAEIDHAVWYIRTTGLPQSVIESIQLFNYKKGQGLIGTSNCSVCLSEFEDGESLRLLPKCSHAFHVPCIDTWLGSHTNCPLCRAPILATGGGHSSLVESSSSLSLVSDDGREGNWAIESREQGSGEIRNGSGISSRMEGVRRSVSLDISSAVDINVEANKAFWTKRSISISGPSILV